MVVDTACSSSLVAIHLACQSLRRRESDAALVGGTNLHAEPGNQHRLLAVGDAVARTASARPSMPDADGYVRSEGCGVVVLKRLGRCAA